MPAVKVSSKVDEKVWSDLRALANETHQNVSGLLTEAIQEYVARRRVRPLFHLFTETIKKFNLLNDHGDLPS
jgi:hypothetical protein